MSQTLALIAADHFLASFHANLGYIAPSMQKASVNRASSSPGALSGDSLGRSSTAAPQPHHVPDHELLRCIGRGSYGEVWLARNVVGTFRAVKIVSRRDFSEAYPFEREFKGIQKYEPISRSHEGLIDILQIGRNDQAGYFYYVMELAEALARRASDQYSVISDLSPLPEAGASAATPAKTDNGSLITDYFPRTLRAELKRRGRLPLGECLQVGLSLSSALEHLHRSGLVHRDIKPSNITFVQGTPKLADIGLVADVDEARSFVGTIGFIAPEGPGSAQADVYSLGKVLYEMVTGKDRQEFPGLPEEFQGSADTRLKELNRVVLRACEGDQRLRYPSAQAMHEDLARVAQGRSARGTRVWRHPAKVIFGISLIVLALIGTIVGSSITKAPKHGGSSNPEAVRLYELGQWHQQQLTDDSLKKGINELNRAIQIDPTYVPAYSALFRIYMWDAPGVSKEEKIQKVRQIAGKLMSLAPKRPESRVALSWSRYLDGDWVGAEAEIQRALSLNSNYSHARTVYCYYLSLLGRVEEAQTHGNRAQELEPLSRTVATVAGYPFVTARDYDGAIAQFRRALYLDPYYALAHQWIGKVLEAKGDYLGALAEFEQNSILSGEDETKVRPRFQAIREAYTNSGPPGYWLKVLQVVEQAEASGEQAKASAKDHWSLDGIYAQLGETNKALDLLQKNYEEGDRSAWLKLEPLHDPIRGEPRFQALLRKLGLEK